MIDKYDLTDEVREKADGKFISLPSGNTHYETIGEKGEWCVLVHGYATPYFIYDRLAAALVKDGYRILRYDLLGRGLSERVKGEYTPSLFVRQLSELTERLLGDERFYLFGTSMGGIITTSFVTKYPKKVKKLVLLAPAGMIFDAPAYMKISKIKGLGEIMFKTIAGKILVKKCASELIYSVDARNDYEKRFAECAKYKGMMSATLSSLRHTILDFETARLGYEGTRESGIPVLTIWGTIDKTMPYYQAERMKKVLPDMELVTYEGSGHIFLFDEGERTAKTVLPFLKR